MSRFHEIKGCAHVHIPLSMLEVNLDPVGEAGEKAGVDFVIINSHTPEKRREKYEKLFSYERYYGGTLVIKGEEADNANRKNHVIFAGPDRWLGHNRDTSSLLEAINREEGVSFIAHPEGFHKIFAVKKDYRWQDWDINSFTGIEMWSLLFDWTRTTRIYNIPARYLSIPYSLEGPSSRMLDIWDTLSLERRVVGIAGLDIHRLPLLFRLLDVRRIFSYEKIFRTLRNHLLLRERMKGNVWEDKKNIIRTFRRGNLFFANDYISPSDGFFFGGEDESFVMGDTADTDARIIVSLPRRCRVRLLVNGKIGWEEETECRSFKAGKPGVYRIEAFLNGKPWIFSNHIRIMQRRDA